MSKPPLKSKSTQKQKTYSQTDGPSSYTEEASLAYAAAEIKKVNNIMGISGRKTKEDHLDSYYIHLIRKGVPRKAIDRLISATGFTEDEMSSLLHISKRTLQRRDPQTLLNPEQSERLIEIAKLYSKGSDAFGNLENFRHWMSQEIISLGNKKPKDFLDTSLGINMLLDELGRIEHGVFS